MLVLTQQAAEIIRALMDQSGVETGGLRIASTSDGLENLTLSQADGPEKGDQIVDDDGARVFVDPAAVLMLDDKILDAHIESEGIVRFELQQQ
ncbi:MAG TPA: hypothetical protein VF183_12020 [Acidimicrobiales bacterium]